MCKVCDLNSVIIVICRCYLFVLSMKKHVFVYYDYILSKKAFFSHIDINKSHSYFDLLLTYDAIM